MPSKNEVRLLPKNQDHTIQKIINKKINNLNDLDDLPKQVQWPLNLSIMLREMMMTSGPP